MTPPSSKLPEANSVRLSKPMKTASPPKPCPAKDKDARRVKKEGKFTLGYKQHTRTDSESYAAVEVRYVVEQTFGKLHRKFGCKRVRYFGLRKVLAQSHLKAVCLNLLKAANRLRVPAAA